MLECVRVTVVTVLCFAARVAGLTLSRFTILPLIQEFVLGSLTSLLQRENPSYPRGLIVTTILLMIIVQLPILDWLAPGNGFSAMLCGELVFWLFTAIILCYVLFVERNPLSSIGLVRPSWKSAAYGCLGAAVMVAGAIVIYTYVFPLFKLQPNAAGLITVQKLPLWFQITVLVRAPVFEEIFYRGFLIERLGAILGARFLAAIISLAAFTFAHLQYWGWSALIVVGFQGLVLTALYLWRRDLIANMIAHFLTDAVALFAF